MLVDRGEPHTFGNAGTGTARLLIIHAPAKDAYFTDLAALHARGTPDPEEERAVMRRHGLEPVI